MTNTTTEYRVTWRESKGVEPCGATEWDYKGKEFNNEDAARDLFHIVSRQHSYAKLRKVTEELLAGSE